MEKETWTQKQLHSIADRIYNLIAYTENSYTITEIDVAARNDIHHFVDTADGLDLHKVVNDSTGFCLRNEKPRIRIPSEMSFERERISLKNSRLIREYSSLVREIGPVSSSMDEEINRLTAQIRRRLHDSGPKMSDLKVQISRLQTENYRYIAECFKQFVHGAKQRGIAPPVNHTRKRTSSQSFSEKYPEPQLHTSLLTPVSSSQSPSSVNSAQPLSRLSSSSTQPNPTSRKTQPEPIPRASTQTDGIPREQLTPGGLTVEEIREIIRRLSSPEASASQSGDDDE